MRIGIVGHGALGTLYGQAFSTVPGAQVIYISNRERVERLRRRPLTANGAPFEYTVESPEDAQSAADIMVCAVKYHHLKQAVEDMRAHVGPDTIFVSVMNGIDSEEYIASVYGKAHVVHSVALGMDAVRAGQDTRFTTPGKLLLGRATAAPQPDHDLNAFTRLCDAAGIAYEIQADILRSIWSKFMLNIGVNQVSAILQAPYDPFQHPSYAQDLMRTAMQETIAVARPLDIHLYSEDIDNLIAVLKTLSPQGKTSMCQDIEAGRKTEVEMFAGKLIELAEQQGVEVPVNRTLYSLIKAKEALAGA